MSHLIIRARSQSQEEETDGNDVDRESSGDVGEGFASGRKGNGVVVDEVTNSRARNNHYGSGDVTDSDLMLLNVPLPDDAINCDEECDDDDDVVVAAYDDDVRLIDAVDDVSVEVL